MPCRTSRPQHLDKVNELKSLALLSVGPGGWVQLHGSQQGRPPGVSAGVLAGVIMARSKTAYNIRRPLRAFPSAFCSLILFGLCLASQRLPTRTRSCLSSLSTLCLGPRGVWRYAPALLAALSRKSPGHFATNISTLTHQL